MLANYHTVIRVKLEKERFVLAGSGTANLGFKQSPQPFSKFSKVLGLKMHLARTSD
jgi:hypothetical protein